MPGTRITTLSFLAALPLAAAVDYFPLHTGNTWVYRSQGPFAAGTLTVEVRGTERIGSQTYARVRGLGAADTLLRQNEAGTVYAYDSAGGRERIWVDFAAPERQSFPTAVDPCNATGAIESKAARYSGPLGEFSNALEVRYGFGGCADAGLESDTFLPYIGLLRRTSQTIAGPRSFDLVYARVGGITVVSEGEVAFSLALDRGVYTADLMPPLSQRAVPVMTARLTLRNTREQPVELQFGSGQRFEIVLKNAKGEEVYRWSNGKFFTQALGSETLGPGERNWAETIRLAPEGATLPFPEGRYTAEAWLTTLDGEKRFSASVGFEIRHVH